MIRGLKQQIYQDKNNLKPDFFCFYIILLRIKNRAGSFNQRVLPLSLPQDFYLSVTGSLKAPQKHGSLKDISLE